MGGSSEVRDLKFNILHELVTEYPIQGVELDFTAAFGDGGCFFFNDGGTPENTATDDRVGASGDGNGALAAG